MPPLLALLACLALGAGCLGAETPCQAPLSWRRHARLSGGQLRLASFIARLDGLRVSLEYDKESVIDEDKWVLDIDIATTSCLMKDGEAWTSTLDEADEDLLARECDPGSGYQQVTLDEADEDLLARECDPDGEAWTSTLDEADEDLLAREYEEAWTSTLDEADEDLLARECDPDEEAWTSTLDEADEDLLARECDPGSDGEAWTSTLDEADEDLLARECDPGSGYQLVEGAWLKLHRRPLDWKYAQEVCWREGGRLAVVDTRLKVAALRQVLLARPDVLQSSVLRGQVLVGMNDVRREGVFETSSGEVFEPWNEMVWFPNEPDDASPGEDCVTFHVLGRIRDVPCYYELPFVCERESP
ncbi:uncharacterized protein LOC134532224 [Bacillus rossius redtenbacheri]|uniref:uncharacterized protein LOC134532224 n=1 Tax=Bacillus rossius redtenbacheri TaxID=93214 RepID=UPI002FDD5525